MSLTAFSIVLDELSNPNSKLSFLICQGVLTIDQLAYGLLLFDKFIQVTKKSDWSILICYMYTSFVIAHKVLQDCYAPTIYFTKIFRIPLKYFKRLEIDFLQSIDYQTSIDHSNFDISLQILKQGTPFC